MVGVDVRCQGDTLGARRKIFAVAVYIPLDIFSNQYPLTFMSETAIDVDIEASTPFDPNKWLKQNLSYPSEPPLEVQQARKQLDEIPSSMLELLHPKISIHEFSMHLLPDEDIHFDLISTAAWFSMDEPNAEVDILLQRTIPASVFVKRLHESALSQAWFDGGTRRVAFIPPVMFLCLLTLPPTLSKTVSNIFELSATDMTLYHDLISQYGLLKNAVALMGGQRKIYK